jgi:SAM-dependent methyltransferase
MSLLDWGCGLGKFAAQVAATGQLHVAACDIDDQFVAQAAQLGAGAVEPFVIDERAPVVALPDATFDVVTMLDVVEHLGPDSLQKALAEIARLLRPGGLLVITVPHRGFFHWADIENLKFRLPRAHRALYVAARGEADYSLAYGDGSRFGNYSVDGRWHRHFTLEELDDEVSPRFTRAEVQYFSVYQPCIAAPLILTEAVQKRLGRRGGLLNGFLWKAYVADADRVTDRRAYSVAASYSAVIGSR